MSEKKYQVVSLNNQNKINKMKQKLEINKNKIKELKNNSKNVTDINKKLSENYQNSLRIIIDISNLLDKYTKLFGTVEEILKDLESNVEFKESDFNHIKNFTNKNSIDIKNKMNNQLDKVIDVLEKKGYNQKAEEYKKFKNNNMDIYTMAKITEKNSSDKTVNAKQIKIAQPIMNNINSINNSKSVVAKNISLNTSKNQKINTPKNTSKNQQINTSKNTSKNQQINTPKNLPKKNKKTLSQIFNEILYK
jgi:hypothetical protein